MLKIGQNAELPGCHSVSVIDRKPFRCGGDKKREHISMPMPVGRVIRNFLFAAALFAAAAGAQEGESLDLPDPDGPQLDDLVFEEKVFADETFPDEAPEDQVLSGPTDQLLVPVADGPPTPVAEDQIEADEVAFGAEDEEQAPELSDVEILVQEFERYKELMQSGVYDEADSAAKRVVELSLKVTGPASLETAKALTNLAIVQHRNQQYNPAQQNYLAAIDIIEEADNRLSDHLVNPLRGLGAAQLEGGRPDLAMTTYSRAVHITHVNEGPHNIQQLELLQSLAEVSLRLGETDTAKDLQDRMYMLNVRYFSGNTMELIPPLLQRAEWQHRAGMIVDERATYRRIIQLIEKDEGKDSLSLIDPLIGYGKSYLYADLRGMTDSQPTGMGTGEMYFRRAVRIAENNPESDWKARAVTLLALGDYYMSVGSDGRGQKTYAEAWEMLSLDEDGLEFRRNMLERPYLLQERPLPQYMSNAPEPGGPDQFLTGTLSLSFNVSERGSVSALRMIEAEPPEFTEMQRAVQRNLRSRTYRPRFADGQPAVSTDQILVHTFYYRQAELDELRPKDAEPEAPQEAAATDPG